MYVMFCYVVWKSHQAWVEMLEIELARRRRDSTEGMGREKSLSHLIVKLEGQAPKVLQDPPSTNSAPLRFSRPITTFSHRLAEG